MEKLSSLTFESGSKLREIQSYAFADCPSLKSIFIPASVSVLSGNSFGQSSIGEIVVDEANPFYCTSGQFLMTLDETKLVRYSGSAENVILNADSDPHRESTIVLASRSRLTQIDQFAFSDDDMLQAIRIPASVEIIGEGCFTRCTSLSQLTFESGSRLARIGNHAFWNCSSLVSICLPALVEEIPNRCFGQCTSLADLLFEDGSKLVRIHYGAFQQCNSLRSFAIPARLEIMELGALLDCESLRELTFGSPSRLKQLDLPRSDFGHLRIPDSVEVVRGNIRTLEGRSRALQFSRASSLHSIDLREFSHFIISLPGDNEPGNNVFVRLSEEILRRFRSGLEGED
jgi:hypothetical protein